MTFAGAAHHTDIILHSLYAESEADYLHFRLEGGDSLELLGTPYTSRLPAGSLQILHVYRSFPAFLASLVNDMFERQTVSATLGP